MRHLTRPSPWTVLSPTFTSKQISLSRTLQGGQCFTWRCVMPSCKVYTSSTAEVDAHSDSGRLPTLSGTPNLSSDHPSFIGAFKGHVVQLGIAESSGAVIARLFGSLGETSTARVKPPLPSCIRGGKRRVLNDTSICDDMERGGLRGVPELDDLLRHELLHYLSAEEDLDALLVEWRRSGHPITSLLPLPPSSFNASESNGLFNADLLTTAPETTPMAAHESNETLTKAENRRTAVSRQRVPTGSKRARDTVKKSDEKDSTDSPNGGIKSVSTLAESPVRLLKQDFIECFFSFLCSQNNNVKRISGMVLKLAEAYGSPLGYVTLVPLDDLANSYQNHKETRDGQTAQQYVKQSVTKRKKTEENTPPQQFSTEDSSGGTKRLDFFAFPSLDELKSKMKISSERRTAAAAKALEKEVQRLRDLGFGYRARYIVACVEALTSSLVEALTEIQTSPSSLRSAKDTVLGSQTKQRTKRNDSLEEEREEWVRTTIDVTERKRRILTSLSGVGRKVADCVLLFSLNERTLVPIDTHMAQLAALYFRDELVVPNSKITAAKSRGLSPKSPPKGKDIKKSSNVEMAGKSKQKETQARADTLATVTLTPAMHDRMQACYLRAFGREAGWAHSFLFAERIGEQNTT